jgi:ATP-dependent helicase Lhr and Lhr-like helicase
MRDRYGLPSSMAGLNHLGKQLAAKRRAEAKLGVQEEIPAAQKRQKKEQLSEKKVHRRKSAEAWFKANKWKPFNFQRETWAHIAAGNSGLVHASTGSGKTYAVWLGILDAFAGVDKNTSLKVLWLTPMRALATDTTKALARAAEEIGTNWRVEARTGDTDTAQKTRQSKALPEALVTTPESLCLMLARADAKEILSGIQAIVVDEWHELLGNKRGVQTQLALAHIRAIAPQVLVWGVSATLGNLEEAAAVLMGSPPRGGGGFSLVSGLEPKILTIDTLLPPSIERFPWAGHIGLRMLPEVIREIESSASTLIFTNVRSASEIWYQAILNARPDWAGLIAVHHGSLSREVRTFVEDGIKSGALKAVVCTSSLDLGVDFLPVERVLQIGSPKGIARLLQRAGRSGHAPGRPSRITIVPTQAIELVEAAAAREAAHAKRIEARTPPHAPLDVLVQHMVTLGLGAGFAPQGLFDEVRTTHAYRTLTHEAFDWCLQFASDGGALTAYPDYHKLVRDDAGIYRVVNPMIARRHRMSIGTIVSDGAIDVKWQSGGRLGSIEESFIARLKVGDVFSFAGHVLELVRVRDMAASVKKSKRKTGIVPQWGGGRMPLSTELAEATLALLGEMAQDKDASPEAVAIRPLINVQIAKSALPTPQRLVIPMRARTFIATHLSGGSRTLG